MTREARKHRVRPPQGDDPGWLGPEKGKPAEAGTPGEPNSKATRDQRYEQRESAASPTEEQLRRARLLIGYWQAHRTAKKRDILERAWLDALAFDEHAPIGATRLGLIVASYPPNKDGWRVVPQRELAWAIRRTGKIVGDTSAAMQDLGYFDYEPGRKNVGNSRYRLRVPDIANVQDAISPKKTSGCDSKIAASVEDKPGATGERKLRAVKPDSPKKTSATYNSTLTKGSWNSSLNERSVPHRGDASSQMKSDALFVERPRRNTDRQAKDRRKALGAPSASDRKADDQGAMFHHQSAQGPLGDIDHHLARLRSIRSAPAPDHDARRLLASLPPLSKIEIELRVLEGAATDAGGVDERQQIKSRIDKLNSLRILATDLSEQVSSTAS